MSGRWEGRLTHAKPTAWGDWYRRARVVAGIPEARFV